VTQHKAATRKKNARHNKTTQCNKRKRSRGKQNKTKQNKTKQNKIKRNETMQCKTV
jgi:hypothetical protein